MHSVARYLISRVQPSSQGQPIERRYVIAICIDVPTPSFLTHVKKVQK